MRAGERPSLDNEKWPTTSLRDTPARFAALRSGSRLPQRQIPPVVNANTSSNLQAARTDLLRRSPSPHLLRRMQKLPRRSARGWRKLTKAYIELRSSEWHARKCAGPEAVNFERRLVSILSAVISDDGIVSFQPPEAPSIIEA